MILETIFVMLVMWLIVKYILRMLHTESYVKHLKFGGTFIPFLGNVLSLVGKSKTEIYKEFVRSIKETGTPCKRYIGSNLCIFIDKPEDVKAVLTQCLDKPFVYGFMPCKLGLIFETSSAIWKPSRKLLNPIFSLKNLQSSIHIFNEKTKMLVEEVGKEVGKDAFDILPYAHACALRGIWSAIMGVDIDFNPGQTKEFVGSIKGISDSIFKRCTRPWTYIDFIHRWTSLYKEEQNHYAKVRNLTNQVFEEQTKAYLGSNMDNDNVGFEHHNINRNVPIMSLFSEGKFSEELVKDQIEALIIAGYNGTSYKLSYIILTLAIHPNIQEQVFNELHSVFDTQDEETTSEHIQKMPLLDRVIKEAMRLCPSAPFIERVSMADVQISNCLIPKDTFFILMFYTLHRRSDIWGDDADEFNPDHFLPGNVQSHHPFAFLPFGGGSRNCIGNHYAMLSMKVMLAALLRNYKFSTHLKWSELEYKFEITLNLLNEHLVKVERQMILETIFVMLVMWLIVKYILRMLHTESYVKHLKFGGTFIPFLGNVLSLVGKSQTEIYKNLVQTINKTGTPFKGYIGSNLCIFIDKPEDMKAVLTQCLDKPFVYGFLPCKLGLVFETSSAIWKPSRKLLNPIFNLKNLQSSIHIFNEKTKMLVEEVRKEVGKDAFDIRPYAHACALRGIWSAIMGVDVDFNPDQTKEFGGSITGISDSIFKRCSRPWTYIDFIYRWTNVYKEEKNHYAKVRNLTNQVFEEQTKAYLSNIDNDNVGFEHCNKNRNVPILSLFYEGKFSEELVKDQIENLTIAGYDSTSSTLSYIILTLAIHPNIQEQVFNELHSVFDIQDEETTSEHIQKMPLLDRVIKEAMRLCPSAPFIERVSMADVQISNCLIPKDTFFILMFYTLHRRRDIWGDDADEFNPDHFLPENVQSHHPFAFLPFGGGSRNCIGNHYAMLSMKVMLAALLRNYKFSTHLKWSELEYKFDITLKLVNEYLVKVERRNW
ncbi:uncharacterized protein LOC129579448 [Sitodiplosis mosellana]|uniref:uncharacterized protein LOC129579448 n=1 Tax=Sitodiplosis mosellana TaxID=263140 RepID=UPI002444DEC4|nr:uncharacterized protein LOC129579448 [Sitodiplosis mosellana]